MRRFDTHPDIVEWSSEEVIVPYYNPAKKRGARYFPDFVIRKRLSDGSFKKIMIEVKPKAQTAPPDPAKKHNTPTGRVSRRYLKEAITYAVNEAKWKAAQEYCADRGWEFVIMTEKEIY
ncbi:MAG: TnsA endonuclease N-terminal domain-containing protein [Anaerolineaceae bacterium]